MVDVVLVEDDERLRAALDRALSDEGYSVTALGSGRELLAHVADEDAPRAFVMDIGLPDSDGRDLCHSLRARWIDTPVLFLTARDSLHDKLSGFDAGGDDYMVKPFALGELLARLEVMIRRTSPAPAAQPITALGIELDPTELSVRGAGADEVQRLSPTEFRLLAHLLAHAGASVPRKELKRAGWPRGAIVHDDTLNTLMARLRGKLRSIDGAASIHTIPHVGYRIGEA
jgi:two-component system response regulator MprA